MLRLIVLWSFFIFLINAQATISPTSSTQTSIQSSSSSTGTNSFVTSSFSLAFPSTSTPSSTSSTSTTPIATIPPTTVAQGPVGQPPSTTAVPGGPTPYTYTTVADGVTQLVTAIFTPTSPATILSVPTQVGTVLGFSSWQAIYSPTHSSSAGAGYPLPLIPFTFILIMLLGILGGGGMLYV